MSLRTLPLCVFFSSDTSTTQFYTLSLHDALPISVLARRPRTAPPGRREASRCAGRPSRRSTGAARRLATADRKSTRLNSSHTVISYAVFCLKKKKIHRQGDQRALGPAAVAAGHDK